MQGLGLRGTWQVAHEVLHAAHKAPTLPVAAVHAHLAHVCQLRARRPGQQHLRARGTQCIWSTWACGPCCGRLCAYRPPGPRTPAARRAAGPAAPARTQPGSVLARLCPSGPRTLAARRAAGPAAPARTQPRPIRDLLHGSRVAWASCAPGNWSSSTCAHIAQACLKLHGALSSCWGCPCCRSGPYAPAARPATRPAAPASVRHDSSWSQVRFCLEERTKSRHHQKVSSHQHDCNCCLTSNIKAPAACCTSQVRVYNHMS